MGSAGKVRAVFLVTYAVLCVATLAVLANYESHYQADSGAEYSLASMTAVEYAAYLLSYALGFPLSIPIWLLGEPHGYFLLTALPNSLLLAELVLWSRRRSGSHR